MLPRLASAVEEASARQRAYLSNKRASVAKLKRLAMQHAQVLKGYEPNALSAGHAKRKTPGPVVFEWFTRDLMS